MPAHFSLLLLRIRTLLVRAGRRIWHFLSWARSRRWRRRAFKLYEHIIGEEAIRYEAEAKKTFGAAAPLVLTNYVVPELFADPATATHTLQLKTARTLFRLVGGNYLPARLISLLHAVDAFQATSRFLRALNLEYDKLLGSREEREFFGYLLGVLFEADMTLRESGLSDLPLYHVLARHDREEIEACIDRMGIAAAVSRAFGRHEIIFPTYYESFLARAAMLLRDWATLENEILEDIRETHTRWAELQAAFDRLCREIDEYVRTVSAKLPESGPLRHTFIRIVSQIHEVRGEIETGATMPQAGIEALLSLFEDELRIVGDEILREAAPGEDFDMRRRREKEERVRAAVKILGLEFDERLTVEMVKKAYRKRVREVHPDHASGGEGDAELFIRLNEAYEFVKNYLKSEGVHA